VFELWYNSSGGQGAPLSKYNKSTRNSIMPIVISNPASIGDPLWNDVVLLMHMDGTNGSTTFIDEKGHSPVAHSDAKISTTQQKFGSASANFDGGDDNVSIVDSTDWNLSGDFTIEFFARWSSVSSEFDVLFGQSNIVTTFAPIRIDFFDGDMQLLVSSDATSWGINSGSVTAGIVINTWYHIAVTRSGNVWKMFVDGVEIYTTTVSITPYDSSNDLKIGGNGSSTPSHSMNGYIDELRVTKGVSRYNSNFTPPTEAFPNN